MNQAIKQTSRNLHTTKKIQKQSTQIPVGRNELENIAGTYGLDLSELNDEAEQFWKMLDDLHESDLESYHHFVKYQLSKGPNKGLNQHHTKPIPISTATNTSSTCSLPATHNQLFSAHSTSSLPNSSSSTPMMVFVPQKGLVVKTFCKPSHDTKVSSSSPSVSSIGASFPGEYKLFINICHHEKIKTPDDASNNSNSGIPMVLSKLRTHRNDDQKKKIIENLPKNQSASKTDVFYTVDIVVPSHSYSSCSNNNIFKCQLINLGIQTIQEKYRNDITIVTEGNQFLWKLIKSTYKGGVGPNHNSVHPFPIKQQVSESTGSSLETANDYDTDTNQSVKDSDHVMNRNNVTQVSIIDDPSTLLKNWKSNENDIDTHPLETSNSILISEMNGDENLRMKQPLIQEIPSSSDSTNNTDHFQNPHPKVSEEKKIQTNQKVPLSRQMKGFLNKKSKTNIQLYDKPSTGDGLDGTGGAYTKFMSKCMVVDTSQLQSSASISKSKELDNGDGKEVVSNHLSVKKGFLNNQKCGLFEERNEREGVGEFDAELRKIIHDTDPELGSILNEMSEESGEGDIEKVFAKLTDITISQNAGSSSCDEGVQHGLPIVDDSANIQSKNIEAIDSLCSFGNSAMSHDNDFSDVGDLRGEEEDKKIAEPQSRPKYSKQCLDKVDDSLSSTDHKCHKQNETAKQKKDYLPYKLCSDGVVYRIEVDLMKTRVEDLKHVTLEISEKTCFIQTKCGSKLQVNHSRISGENAIAKFNKKKRILKITFPP